MASADYTAYHDDEWGRPVRDDVGIFERLCLEAFQSGLSWLTILRKRQNFRAAFAGFEPTAVAAFGPDDVVRLLGDSGIVRNRAKIEAAISNARAALDLPSGLAATVWSYAEDRRAAPVTLEDVPAWTPASKALSAHLRRHGFRFTGPVTAYSTMQACGVVDDHLVGCFCRTIGPGSGSAGSAAGEGASAARLGSEATKTKPTIAQLGIDLTALTWRRSGSGAGSFEVAFVICAPNPAAGTPVGSGPSGPETPTVGTVPARLGAQPGEAGFPTDATAEWVLLRVAGDPAARVLIYDRVEWASFVDGAARGEFDDVAALG